VVLVLDAAGFDEEGLAVVLVEGFLLSKLLPSTTVLLLAVLEVVLLAGGEDVFGAVLRVFDDVRPRSVRPLLEGVDLVVGRDRLAVTEDDLDEEALDVVLQLLVVVLGGGEDFGAGRALVWVLAGLEDRALDEEAGAFSAVLLLEAELLVRLVFSRPPLANPGSPSSIKVSTTATHATLKLNSFFANMIVLLSLAGFPVACVYKCHCPSVQHAKFQDSINTMLLSKCLNGLFS